MRNGIARRVGTRVPRRVVLVTNVRVRAHVSRIDGRIFGDVLISPLAQSRDGARRGMFHTFISGTSSRVAPRRVGASRSTRKNSHNVNGHLYIGHALEKTGRGATREIFYRRTRDT